MGGGDVVHDQALSYVVAMRGNFTVEARRPFVPHDQAATSPITRDYSVITMVVDAATGRVMDYGLVDCMPDISTAGPVTTDIP
jgi:hypothetical protein